MLCLGEKMNNVIDMLNKGGDDGERRDMMYVVVGRLCGDVRSFSG